MPNRLFCGCCGCSEKITLTYFDSNPLGKWYLFDADESAETAFVTDGEVREGVTVLSKQELLPNADAYSFNLVLRGMERLSFPLKFRAITQASVSEVAGYEPELGDHLFAEFEVLGDDNDVDDFKWKVRLSIGKVVSGVETVLDTTFFKTSSTTFTTSNNIAIQVCRSTAVGYDGDIPVVNFRIWSIQNGTIVNMVAVLDTDAPFDPETIYGMHVVGDEVIDTPEGLHVGYQLITDSDTQDEPKLIFAKTSRSQTEDLEECPRCVTNVIMCPCALEVEKEIWAKAESDALDTAPPGYDFGSVFTNWFVTRYGFDSTTETRNLCRFSFYRLGRYTRPASFLTGNPNTIQTVELVQWADMVVVVTGGWDRVQATLRSGIYALGNTLAPPSPAPDPADVNAAYNSLSSSSPTSVFQKWFPTSTSQYFQMICRTTLQSVPSLVNIYRMDRDIWDCENFSFDLEYTVAGTQGDGTTYGIPASVYLGKTVTISNL